MRVAKAQRLNADAHTLATVAKSVGHAAVLFSYAVEEVGKAGLLWDALQTNQANQATVAGFANHTAKLERAETLLGERRCNCGPGRLPGTRLPVAASMSGPTPPNWRIGLRASTSIGND